MTKVKVGVQLHPQHCTYEQLRDVWLRLDAMGVDSIWNWDHFFPLYGESNGPHWEGWTTLAAIGAQTRYAQVACLVLCMSYRNAALLSQMAKTLDHATGGRLILGMGAGWAERDYREYGYDFGTAGQRLKNMERSIEIIKDRWQKDNPKTVRGTIPIMVGGGGEKVTLRITAQHADLWNGFGDPQAWGRKNQILTDWCQKVGRDPAAIERTVSMGTDGLGDLDRFVEVGATHIICRLAAPFDTGPIEQMLAWRDRKNAG